MKLTLAMKQWASANCGVAADASDEAFKKAIGDAIVSGKLTTEKFSELNTTKELSPLELFTKSMERLNDRLDVLEKGGKKPKKMPIEDGKDATLGMDDPTKAGKRKPVGGDEEEEDDGDNLTLNVVDGSSKTLETIVEKTASSVFGAMRNMMGGNGNSTPLPSDDGPKPIKLFTDAGDDGAQTPVSRISIKSAVAQYDGTRSMAVYSKDCKHVELRGMQVHSGENGRALETSSKRDKAVTGAWFKFTVNVACKAKGQSVPRCYRMTEHDNALVKYAIHEMPFTGLAGWNENDGSSKFQFRGDRKMTDIEIKAVLDDTVSGGLDAAPIVFDDALILFPLLYGELFPLVNVVNMTRGRRVEGFSMQNPTIQSGIAEGTDIPLFDTASFIAAFDTTIYNAVGAMEIGKDFEDDSPVNIGEQIVARYGDAMLQWLDRVVVVGDGVTEPDGIFNASGTVAVTSDNSTSGPPTLSDYEGLLFGVKKQYRQPQDRARCIYATNETTYRRSRGMKVDPQASSTDERRLLGLNHEDYTTLGHPHKINESIANGKAAFFNARRYRMYRRLGMNVAIEEGGKELVRRNTRLIVVRARFGGQLEDGNAASVCTSMQS